MGRGFIPFAGMVTQGNDIFASNKKQTSNAWQNMITSIPIARNLLNDKINALGDPVKVDVDVIESGEVKDPVWKFLLEKQGWVAPVNKNTLIIFDEKTQEDRPPTMDEYYNFSKLRGAKIKAEISELMKVKKLIDWNTGDEITTDKMSEKQFNLWLSKIEKKATKEAKEELFGVPPPKETPDLEISQ